MNINNFSMSKATYNLSSDAKLLSGYCNLLQQTTAEVLSKDFRSDKDARITLDAFLVDLFCNMDHDAQFSHEMALKYLPLSYDLRSLKEGHNDSSGVNLALYSTNLSMVETLWAALKNLNTVLDSLKNNSLMDTRKNESLLATVGDFDEQFSALTRLLPRLAYRTCPIVRLCEAVQRVTHKPPSFDRLSCDNAGSTVKCTITLGEQTISHTAAGKNTKTARYLAAEALIDTLLTKQSSRTNLSRESTAKQTDTKPQAVVRPYCPELDSTRPNTADDTSLEEVTQQFVYGVYIEGEQRGYSFTAGYKTFSCDHIFGWTTATDVRYRTSTQKGYDITTCDDDFSNFTDNDAFMINMDNPVIRISNRFYAASRAVGYSGSPLFRVCDGVVTVAGVLLGGVHTGGLYQLSVAMFSSDAGATTTLNVLENAELWTGRRSRSNSFSMQQLPPGHYIISNSNYRSGFQQQQNNTRSRSQSIGPQNTRHRSSSRGSSYRQQQHPSRLNSSAGNCAKNIAPQFNNNGRQRRQSISFENTNRRHRSQSISFEAGNRRHRSQSRSSTTRSDSNPQSAYHIPAFKGKRKPAVLTKATITHSQFISVGSAIAGTLRHSKTIKEDGFMFAKDICKQHKITIGVLNDIIRENSKQRFQVSKDGLKVRCLHGHSTRVNPDEMGYGPLKEGIVYHVTGAAHVNSILEEGLLRYSRQFIHFIGPAMTSTVKRKGARYVECEIAQLTSAGLTVWCALNGVVLVDGDIPAKLIKRVLTPKLLPVFTQVIPVVHNITAVVKKKVKITMPNNSPDAPLTPRKKTVKRVIEPKITENDSSAESGTDWATHRINHEEALKQTNVAGTDWDVQLNTQEKLIKVIPSAPAEAHTATAQPILQYKQTDIYPVIPETPPDYQKVMKDNPYLVPFMTDGKINGYGTIIAGKIYKPLHVTGTASSQFAFKEWKSAGDKTLDLQVASVTNLSAGYSVSHEPTKLSELRMVDNTAVKYEAGRFYITGDKPGLSGSPVLGNHEGVPYVAGIVIGGKPAKEQGKYKLGIVTFHGKNLTPKDEYSASSIVQWSATSNNVHERSTATQVLPLLFLLIALTSGYEYPMFDNIPMSECLTALLTGQGRSFETITGTHGRWNRGTYLRQNAHGIWIGGNPGPDSKIGECVPDPKSNSSTTMTWLAGLSSQAISSPFLDKCEDCGSGPCMSPIAIQEIQFDDGGNIRIKLTAVMGRIITPVGGNMKQFSISRHKTTSYRKTNGIEGIAKVIPDFYVDNRLCTIVNFAGYYAVLQCHPGKEMKVVLRDSSIMSCKKIFKTPVRHRFEESPMWIKHKHTKECTLFQTKPGPSFPEFHTLVTSVSFAHIPMDSLMNTPVPVVEVKSKTVALKRSLRYTDWTITATISCANRTDPLFVKSSHDGRVSARCAHGVVKTLVLNTEDTAQGLSGLYRSVNSTVFEVPQPFAQYNGRCHYTIAEMPKISVINKKVVFTSNVSYPVRLIIFQNTTKVDIWVKPFGNYLSPIKNGRFTFVWGNNDRTERWALLEDIATPHGDLSVQFNYYMKHKPAQTIVVLAIAVCLSIIIIMMCLVILFAARSYLIRSKRITNSTPWSLLLLMCLLPRCRSYEHNVLISTNVLANGYSGILSREGYEPMSLKIRTVSTFVSPALTIDYETCSYSVEARPAQVACCEGQSCAKNTDTYKCAVHTGVYPYVWGAASCFCSSENSQKSEATVKLSDTCHYDKAIAYKTSPGKDRVTLRVTVDDMTTYVNAYVDGQTPSKLKGKHSTISLVTGPMSSTITPFDRKVVEYGDKVYNYDFPEFGSSASGSFGDVQMPVEQYNPTGKGIIINSNVVFLRPDNDNVANRIVAGASGFDNWKLDLPLDVTTENNFGCIVQTKPIRAVNCSMGFVPISVNVPNALFTRKVRINTIDSVECSAESCTYGMIGAGLVRIKVKSPYAVNCLITTNSEEFALHTTYLTLGAGISTHKLNYSTTQHTVELSINVCNLKTVCSANCKPPKPHIYKKPVLLENHEHGRITPSAIRGMISIMVPIAVAAAVLVAIYILYRLCKSRSKIVMPTFVSQPIIQPTTQSDINTLRV